MVRDLLGRREAFEMLPNYSFPPLENYLINVQNGFLVPRERQAHQGRGHFQLIDINGNFLQEKVVEVTKPKEEKREKQKT
jgi:hypothetical protein